MSTEEPKNVDLIITDAVKFQGKHRAVGEVLKDLPWAEASELVGAGRARLFTEEEAAAAKKKSEKAPA